MTNEALLDEVLTEYYDAYLSRFDDVAEHRFSLRHRLKMRKIFKLYEKNVKKLNLKPDVQQMISKVRLNRKTVLAIVAIVLLSLIAGCAVAYFVSESFRGTVHDDNTQLFAINVEGAPTTLEYTYVLSEIPQGFELLETSVSEYVYYVNYYNRETSEAIVIKQYVKSKFALHYNTEQNIFQSIDINGNKGVSLEITTSNGNTSVIIWDDKCYIIEVVSNIDKNKLEKLVKSLKLQNR